MKLQDVTAIVRGLAPVLREHVAFLQAKDRGLDGAPGPTGPAGAQGRDGLPGVPGRDGLRGEKGTDGVNGKDGRDGTLSLDEVEFIQLDERTGVWRDATTGKHLSGEIKIPGFLDRGVYRETESYERGDVVSFGHLFVALRKVAPGEKPIDGMPHEGQAWRLWVKRGRDGKQGPEGKPGDRGPKGEKGDPGRNFS